MDTLIAEQMETPILQMRWTATHCSSQLLVYPQQHLCTPAKQVLSSFAKKESLPGPHQHEVLKFHLQSIRNDHCWFSTVQMCLYHLIVKRNGYHSLLFWTIIPHLQTFRYSENFTEEARSSTKNIFYFSNQFSPFIINF